LYGLPEDPIEVSKMELERPNDIRIFPFICLYVIPVYEKLTGEKNTLEKIAKKYKNRLKRMHKSS
jgi:hypothetical protein